MFMYRDDIENEWKSRKCEEKSPEIYSENLETALTT